jgi:hypothetical protein
MDPRTPQLLSLTDKEERQFEAVALWFELCSSSGVRKFPCQTLKISKVSPVVMGSKWYAMQAASPRPTYRPPGVCVPAGRDWCF